MRVTFDTVWKCITENAGKPFKTKTGLDFTYKVDSEAFYPSRTEYRISKNDFKTACSLLPVNGLGAFSQTVRGPSYIWAVLHDSRIRQTDW